MSTRRRNAEQWNALLAEFAASAQTMAAFCTERGLNAGYFQKKRAQLRRKASRGAFVRAQVAAGAPITVRIMDVEVRCSAELAPEWIAELAAALRP
jgi:hypothetical protein